MMKHKTVGILAIALSLASTGAMARSATAINLLTFSGALIEHGYGAPLVTVVRPDQFGKAPVLQFDSKVSDQHSRKPSTPSIPTPVNGTGTAGQVGPSPSPSQPHVTNAPEMDAASMGAALTLLIGAVAVMRGRRKQGLKIDRA